MGRDIDHSLKQNNPPAPSSRWIIGGVLAGIEKEAALLFISNPNKGGLALE